MESSPWTKPSAADTVLGHGTSLGATAGSRQGHSGVPHRAQDQSGGPCARRRSHDEHTLLHRAWAVEPNVGNREGNCHGAWFIRGRASGPHRRTGPTVATHRIESGTFPGAIWGRTVGAPTACRLVLDLANALRESEFRPSAPTSSVDPRLPRFDASMRPAAVRLPSADRTRMPLMVSLRVWAARRHGPVASSGRPRHV